MKRVVSAAILMIALMTGLAMPAHAETPPNNISTNVVDNTGSLNKDRVSALVAQVQRETGYQLYVYFTDDFSGMSGAQWAFKAATDSHLDTSKAVLFAVAVKERKYGSAFPSNTDVSKKGSTMEQDAIPAMKNGKWTDAVEAYSNQLIAISHKTDAESARNSGKSDAAGGVFLSVITWIIGILVGLGIIVLGFLFGPRGVRKLIDYLHEKNVIRREVEELRVSIPAGITSLDDSILSVKEKLSYAIAMFGELPGVSTNIESAQANMQNAIKKLGKVSASSYGLRGSEYRLQDLRDAAFPIQRGKKDVGDAEKALKDMETRVTSIKFIMAQAVGTTGDLAAKLPEYEETLARVQAKFDQDYLSGLTSTLLGAKKNITASQQSLAEASTAFANNNFDRANELTLIAGNGIAAAKRSFDTFGQKAQEISRFPLRRDKIVRKFESEISADTSENTHASVQSLIPAAKAALVEASELQFLSGNPDKDLAKVLEPVIEYHNAVERMVKVKESVKAEKVRINTSIKAMKNWQKTALVSNVREYGISVTELEKVAISEVEKIMKVDVTGVEWNLKDVSAYDLSSAVTLSKKLDYLNKTAQSLVASITGKIEKAIAAEQRRQEEIRAEEQRRQEEIRAEEERQRKEKERKRKEKDQESKRKRERERDEEDERRRKRNSSSSSYGYGSGSDYGSSSSSSDFSSSGGSFGGGFDSSGGSF